MLEEDGIFGSYVNARHLEQVVGVCIVYFVAIILRSITYFWGVACISPMCMTTIRCMFSYHQQSGYDVFKQNVVDSTTHWKLQKKFSLLAEKQEVAVLTNV